MSKIYSYIYPALSSWQKIILSVDRPVLLAISGLVVTILFILNSLCYPSDQLLFLTMSHILGVLVTFALAETKLPKPKE